MARALELESQRWARDVAPQRLDSHYHSELAIDIIQVTQPAPRALLQAVWHAVWHAEPTPVRSLCVCKHVPSPSTTHPLCQHVTFPLCHLSLGGLLLSSALTPADHLPGPGQG